MCLCVSVWGEVVRWLWRVTLEPLGQHGEFWGEVSLSCLGKHQSQEEPMAGTQGRIEKTSKKGRKWLSVRNWGRQLRECQGAETRDLLGMVTGRGEARTDESSPVPPK